ncbi:hypothetical protein GY21_13040 [Cryobacterium roopkundense]|uniref:Uncharacterized protein n=1 Tax=Cryobacterium roopkundense TaxID=1001240 RepID=A0A099J5J8_9MICO|nr:hypothetical protein [Cryobacterium roopkundense]KGJ72787.1 hypothetical protein GY21_13040 [Cryobacterium roopkundense]MBB5643625.1 hypothetical protein [Cryobacterium roopkundense]
MPQNHTSKAFNTPLKKKIFGGAVTVITAGSLLGLGAVGAQASPLDQVTDTTSGTSATSSTSADGKASTTDDVIAAVKQQLRADLSQGGSMSEKAQNVSQTVAGQSALFASLPANLQADLTSLNAASGPERDALAAQIGTTALDGGYGEEAQKVATAVQDDPKHPLAAALRALVGQTGEHSDKVGEHADRSAEKTSQRVTEALIEHPELFANLPTNLQDDLTALKDAPEADRAVDADAIEAKALAGEYGAEIQKIAGHIQADDDVTAGGEVSADTDVKTDAGTGK